MTTDEDVANKVSRDILLPIFTRMAQHPWFALNYIDINRKLCKNIIRH